MRKKTSGIGFLLIFAAIWTTVVGAFGKMFAETGLSGSLLTVLLLTGRLLVWGAALHVLAIAVGGTWSPRRVTAMAWLADGIYVAVVLVALLGPLGVR